MGKLNLIVEIMKSFTVSRLNTAQGTFKIVGLFEPKNKLTLTIKITSIEMMGTDGWVLLDQTNITVINLINRLHSPISNYLQSHDLATF